MQQDIGLSESDHVIDGRQSPAVHSLRLLTSIALLFVGAARLGKAIPGALRTRVVGGGQRAGALQRDAPVARAQAQDAAVAGRHAHAAARVAAQRKVRAAICHRHLACMHACACPPSEGKSLEFPAAVGHRHLRALFL